MIACLCTTIVSLIVLFLAAGGVCVVIAGVLLMWGVDRTNGIQRINRKRP